MNSKDIDSLWDFNDPASSHDKFVQALTDDPENHEIRTQICRSLGLQRRFDEGWAELARIPSERTPIVQVRVALESGRLKNSSGDKEAAKPYFLEAFQKGEKEELDNYTVDAAHMMGIVTVGEESLDWNEKAIQIAAASEDVRAQNWQGSLLNNTAWTYHDMGRYDRALELFQAALLFRKSQGKPETIRIAQWAIGRCLRSLERYDEAIAIQSELVKGGDQGYAAEEMGELLLITGHREESKPWFRRAYEILSKDIWLNANEANRLERLKDLSDAVQ